MIDLTLQQVLELRQAQEKLNNSKATYMDLYRKIIKKSYTDELNNLVGFYRSTKNIAIYIILLLQIKSEFNIENFELNVPKLPQLVPQPEEYTPMFQVSFFTKQWQLENLLNTFI
ncbi:hypothetical protein KR009_011182, partial [Drosophila setifemur]